MDLTLLLLQLATTQPQAQPALPIADPSSALVAAVLFLLVKELLMFIGKFMPKLTGVESIGGHSAEYWKEIIESRTNEAARAAIDPIRQSLDELQSSLDNLTTRISTSTSPAAIEEIRKGVATLVLRSDDGRIGRARHHGDGS